MKFKLVLLLLTCTAVSYVQSSRILGVFPLPGISHSILYTKLMKGLAEAGHDVTMVSPFKTKDLPKNGKFTDIVIKEISDEYEKHTSNSSSFARMQGGNMIRLMRMMTDLFLRQSNHTFYNPEFRQLLETNQKFDAVVVEQFCNDVLKVLSYVFDCPLIILSSMGANAWVNPTVGNPQPVSYVAHLLSDDFSKDLSFVKRARNLFFYLAEYFIREYYVHPKHEAVMHHAFPNSPPLYDVFRNVSLVLLNSHISVYPALPLVPNMVEIGGYFIDPPKKLPEDLQQFLDSAKDGAIYFSMGSNLKSKDLPEEKQRLLLNVFGKLKQKVLWKFEDDDLPGKPSNVMIRKWLPQPDILAHPNIKLFITHGGLLSSTETIYHGVPILALPVFGDQNANADRAVASGFGLKLEYNSPHFTEELLGKLIDELLYNPQYKENAERKSKIYHDRPVGPMETAVYWVEYVIRHKGAPHLRVAGVKLPWYKYYMVDVFAVLLFIVVAICAALKFVFKKLCSLCTSSRASKADPKLKTH